MAACQLSLLPAPEGFLLLLIATISSSIPEVSGRSINIWCRQELAHMPQNDVKCDTLAFPVQLPFVGMNVAEWAKETLQHKCAEVVGDLQVFRDALQEASKNATLLCQTSVLGKLKRCIRSDLAILNSLQIENDRVAPSPLVRPHFSIETNQLSKVLKQYGLLLKGKLRNLTAATLDIMGKKRSPTNKTGR